MKAPWTVHLDDTLIGTDGEIDFLIRDKNGDPVDISGYSVSFTAFNQNATFSKSVGSGITIDPDQVTNKGEGVIAYTVADLALWAPHLTFDGSSEKLPRQVLHYGITTSFGGLTEKPVIGTWHLTTNAT